MPSAARNTLHAAYDESFVIYRTTVDVKGLKINVYVSGFVRMDWRFGAKASKENSKCQHHGSTTSA